MRVVQPWNMLCLEREKSMSPEISKPQLGKATLTSSSAGHRLVLGWDGTGCVRPSRNHYNTEK